MWAGGVIVAALIAFALLHVSSPRINPAQTAPEGHFTASCWLCHTVSSSASVIVEGAP